MQATRTYLELTDRDQFKTAFGNFPGIDIARASNPSPDLYRMCYRAVGEAFHWFDRWDWSDEEIRKHLADPAITLFVATRGGAWPKTIPWRSRISESSPENLDVALGNICCRARCATRGHLARAVSGCTPARWIILTRYPTTSRGDSRLIAQKPTK